MTLYQRYMDSSPYSTYENWLEKTLLKAEFRVAELEVRVEALRKERDAYSQQGTKDFARIAELEDKLSGKSAEVQSKLVEQEARIAELEKAVEQYLVTEAKYEIDARRDLARLLNRFVGQPKENE